MARIHVEGIDGLENLFGNISRIPNSVINEMLHAQADVVVKAQEETAATMLKGRYSTGELAQSIKKGRITNSKSGKQIKIKFDGVRTRGKIKKSVTSNAEIAFLNEFGTKEINARPFIRTANEKCADEAVEAAEKIFDRFVDTL